VTTQTRRTGSARTAKRELLQILDASDWQAGLKRLSSYSPEQLINPLLGLLLNKNEKTRWRAVSAIGVEMARLAGRNREKARYIMRRLMWSLNDESGGIGWGAPEAMAEIIAQDKIMADEYSAILISYIHPEGNFLEYEPLQRGALWAIARALEAYPDLAKTVKEDLSVYFQSVDPIIRGLAAIIAGRLRDRGSAGCLKDLLDDDSTIRLYANGEFESFEIKELALKALADVTEDN
jgi:hypothetical protein